MLEPQVTRSTCETNMDLVGKCLRSNDWPASGPLPLIWRPIQTHCSGPNVLLTPLKYIIHFCCRSSRDMTTFAKKNLDVDRGEQLQYYFEEDDSVCQSCYLGQN